MVDNGKKIVAAAPAYIQNTIVNPVIKAVQLKVIEPVVRTVQQRIVDPVVKTVQQKIVEPVKNFIANPIGTIGGWFGL